MQAVLSAAQVRPLLRARQEGQSEATTSLDLGLSECQVQLSPEGVLLPGGEQLPWAEVEEVADGGAACFVVAEGGVAERIQSFSEELNRHYSLMATSGRHYLRCGVPSQAPTLLISGIPMHRIKDVDPHQDTLNKIRAADPAGRVLDTATGLGYTAIEAARVAEQVVTIELDPAVLDIARLNPWSQALFDNPRIEQIVGDTFDVIQELADESFSRIVHDPPTFSLAGELYSAACYRQFYRILKRGGRLFHYIGDLESKSGHGVMKGAIRRLQEAGFGRIVRRPEAFGLLAFK